MENIAPLSPPATAVSPRIDGGPRSVACASLKVTYRARLDEEALAPDADRIEVLIPGGSGEFQVFFGGPNGPRSMRVRAPQVSIVPANHAYRIQAQVPCELVTLALDKSFFESKARQSFASPREVLEAHAVSDQFLRGLGNVLANGFRTAAPPTEAYLETLASSLALHLGANYHREPTVAQRVSGLAPHKLQRVLASIEERLAEPIQVQELADVIHMSPFHFARMFKLATGQPPHAYITMLRMERAKALLAGNEFSLAEIASRVGYQTQAHFTGVFHRHVGVTPRTFRVAARNQANGG